MTNAQLKQLVRWAIRYVGVNNAVARQILPASKLSPKDRRAIAMDVAKTDMWLVKARRAVAKPKAARKPK